MQSDTPIRYVFTIIFCIFGSILVAILLHSHLGVFKPSYIFVSLSGGGVLGFIIGAYFDTKIADSNNTIQKLIRKITGKEKQL